MSKMEEKKGLLPVMNPLFNLREICKNVALLEEHLNQPRKRCPDCIRKHFLTIEALYEEAISLDRNLEYGEHLEGKAQEIRDLQGVWIDTKDTKESHKAHLMIAQALRGMRKSFSPLCFDVRKMAKVKRIARSYMCPHMKIATKTQAEKEDEAAQKLIRKTPKKKPPRKDLRKNRVEMTEDPDLKGVGRGDSGDPDLSRRGDKMSSYRMRVSDKKVVDAFVMERSKEGRSLRSDGKKLFKLGLLEGLFARWVGGKILITSPEATKSDETVLRYLVKKAGKGMVRFNYERKDHAEPITFDHGGDVLHAGQYDAYVVAKIGRKVIGRVDFMLWEENGSKKFKIKMVEVDPSYRRGGVATEMYKYMKKNYNLKGSQEEVGFRTDDGSSFRDSVRLAKIVANRYLNERG